MNKSSKNQESQPNSTTNLHSTNQRMNQKKSHSKEENSYSIYFVLKRPNFRLNLPLPELISKLNSKKQQFKLKMKTKVADK